MYIPWLLIYFGIIVMNQKAIFKDQFLFWWKTSDCIWKSFYIHQVHSFKLKAISYVQIRPGIQWLKCGLLEQYLFILLMINCEAELTYWIMQMTEYL